ncbi:MAG: hypothetical protein ABIR62_16295 [Dokdonella sp.]|uniref:hypothetical protein n=1 Tax=Dokdonella sp. TaxID=2291710 RepID=UPI0032664DE0
MASHTDGRDRGQRLTSVTEQSGRPAVAKRGTTELVGPPGLEPGTKGFAYSGSFPTGADYLFTRSFRWWGAGRSSL